MQNYTAPMRGYLPRHPPIRVFPPNAPARSSSSRAGAALLKGRDHGIT